MEEIRILTEVPTEVIHNAFVEAFSDYQVKMDLPLKRFEGMQRRRGFDGEFSIGCFHEGRLVGFILNGCREYNNRKTVYDMGTGVIGAYRKKGITTSLFQVIKKVIKEKGVEVYLLEVLQENTPAVELYKKSGFVTTRNFRCFKRDKDQGKVFPSQDLKDGYKIREMEMTKETLELCSLFWDFNPSWQNSIESVIADKNSFKGIFVSFNDKIIAYGIVDKTTGDIPQLSVDRGYRGNGLGKFLLRELEKATASDKLSILNVQEGAGNMEDFLMKNNFVNYVDQYEMILEI